MSYVATAVLGAAPRARYRRVGRGRNTRAIAASRRPIRRFPHYQRRITEPAISPHYTLGDCDGLGKFSLKRAFTPPRKVRTFVAKHKTALLVGAGVLTAGLFAPAAALAIGKGALVASRFVGRQALKLIPHGSPGTPGTIPDQPDMGPPAPPAPQMPDLTLPSPAQAGGGSGGAQDYGSGGGGGAPSSGGDTSESNVPIDTSSDQAAKPGISPLVVIGGVALLALVFASGRTSKRRAA
jgi:hypothetical protein